MIENEYIFMRFRTTKYYYYFTIFQLTLALTLLVFFFLGKSGIYLETIGATLMTVDILIRYFSQPQFTKSLCNTLDIVVVSSIFFFIIMQLIFNQFSMTSDQLSFLILGTRYGVQLYRMGSLIDQTRKNGKIQNMAQVNLDINFEDSCFENIMQTKIQAVKRTGLEETKKH